MGCVYCVYVWCVDAIVCVYVCRLCVYGVWVYGVCLWGVCIRCVYVCISCMCVCVLLHKRVCVYMYVGIYVSGNLF